jgi:stress response protein YsnF
LYDHYGVGYDAAGDSGQVGVDSTTGNATDSGDAMTRSEERVEVGTRSQEAGRARLRKYVETEHVTQTVPVRREKAVLESEPITDGNIGDATRGDPITEDEHEVVLHEEKPVVQKTTEPVERVRLRTDQTTVDETVDEEVRRERIVAEGEVDQPSRR